MCHAQHITDNRNFIVNLRQLLRLLSKVSFDQLLSLVKLFQSLNLFTLLFKCDARVIKCFYRDSYILQRLSFHIIYLL